MNSPQHQIFCKVYQRPWPPAARYQSASCWYPHWHRKPIPTVLPTNSLDASGNSRINFPVNQLVFSMVSKALMEFGGRPWMLNGAVERTRTSTGCPTATSTLRVYQFRHDRKKPRLASLPVNPYVDRRIRRRVWRSISKGERSLQAGHASRG
jgi:hypothetical protein